MEDRFKLTIKVEQEVGGWQFFYEVVLEDISGNTQKSHAEGLASLTLATEFAFKAAQGLLELDVGKR